MTRPAYPNALVIAHPAISAAAAEHLCHEHGLELSRTENGNFALTKPAAPRFPGSPGRASSPVSLVADAAGPLEAA